MSFDAAEAYQGCSAAYVRFLKRHPSIHRAVDAMINHPAIQPSKKQAKTPKQVRHSEATKKGILEALLKGERNSDIAAAYGVSRTYVCKQRMKANLKPARQWGVGPKAKANN